MTNPLIQIEKLTRTYGRFTALNAVDMQINESEFYSLLGPSGCGKSTLLRLLAGLDEPTSGTVRIEGKDVTRLGAEKRPTNMVFQSYAIFPHMTVFDNVAYGLRRKKIPARELGDTVSETLEKVGLSGLEKRRKPELSGGQLQRVALARALVMRPKVLLLDEPLAALDKKLRQEMQSELRRLQRELGIAFVMVTHDQEEALTISDKVAVMSEGRILQNATPRELYDRPQSRKVAEFVGEMNFFAGEVTGREGDRIVARFDRLETLSLPGDLQPDAEPGSRIEIGIRPEKFFLAGPQTPPDRIRTGRILSTEFFGETTHVFVELAAGRPPITVSVQNEDRTDGLPLERGDSFSLSWTDTAYVAMRPD
ncbi:ABC transporter ATP-binding protein [Palleronia sp. LCG004]|uniref:ABC transporter ATP-binding protein n=1 Tax=Palleronia sp. LCG004 TaxID=3079304 RepID=UPI0029434331|nr:ABC transporter ATP-binding protein [Palleronia sp. LCG004]WOI56584.1 ABC transporter ATP-binding protein [Palleronia sp. LCG004]